MVTIQLSIRLLLHFHHHPFCIHFNSLFTHSIVTTPFQSILMSRFLDWKRYCRSHKRGREGERMSEKDSSERLSDFKTKSVLTLTHPVLTTICHDSIRVMKTFQSFSIQESQVSPASELCAIIENLNFWFERESALDWKCVWRKVLEGLQKYFWR